VTNRIRSFDPIVDENSWVIILGTIPGPESLRRGEYYANKRNQFWKIIYGVFGKKPHSTYQQKIEFLKRKGVALWDVLQSCERVGASDSKITNEKPNDIEGLLRKNPGIRAIFFNGKKSEELFQKLTASNTLTIKHKTLPSSSPANTKSLDGKIIEWERVKELLI
jgi:TDG/mug DNA glycosylase family protein